MHLLEELEKTSLQEAWARPEVAATPAAEEGVVEEEPLNPQF